MIGQVAGHAENDIEEKVSVQAQGNAPDEGMLTKAKGRGDQEV